MITSLFHRYFGLCLLVAWTAAPVNAQFAPNSKWIPDHANTLVLINADQIFSSALATRENWSAAGTGAFQRGHSIVPPGVGKVMLASQLDLEYLEPVWTVGLFADAKADISVAKLAQREGREVEQLGSRDAVALSGDQYVVQLDPKTTGFMVPANRQALARWLKDGDAGRPGRISEYLSNAISYADKNADIIIAFDLDNLFSKTELRTRLMRLESARASQVEPLAEAASKLKGLKLGITIREKITGALRIDFADGTKDLALVSKKLILEALSNNGVMLDDFLNWELKTEGSRVVFTGPLSTSGLRKISSLVNQPIRAQFSDSSSVAEAKPISPGKASRQYFDSIDLYFRELDEFLAGDRKTNARAYGRWFDKYANNIDALPLRNVDADLIEYGSNISKGFRDISSGLFGADATVQERAAQDSASVTSFSTGRAAVWNAYETGYGYRRRSTASLRKDFKKEEGAKAAASAKSSIAELRKQHGDIRREMSTRYDDF
jgi:hypothetical protein